MDTDREDKVMRYLDSINKEFQTVDLLLGSDANTGCIDGFVISWVKVKEGP